MVNFRLKVAPTKEALVQRSAKTDNEAFEEVGLSDRKYRQRGYQDSGNEAQKKTEKPSTPRKDLTFGPRPLNMPATRTVSRCAECGALLENSSETVGRLTIHSLIFLSAMTPSA